MTSTALYNRIDLTPDDLDGLTVSVYYMGVTNHALAHNRIPVVRFIGLSLPEGATSPSPAGELTVSATFGGRLARATIDFEVLAPDEWFNSPLYYESLAAWVQPNSPSEVQCGTTGGHGSGDSRAASSAVGKQSDLRMEIRP